MTMLAQQTPRFVSAGPSSPLQGIDNTKWRRFLNALDVQPARAVSDSGGYGSYDIRPRRLQELGVMRGVHSVRKGKRLVQVGEFVSPWTEATFLQNPLAQYTVLARSMVLYDEAIRRGEIKAPSDLPRLEALALLHRAGRGGIEQWPRMFTKTAAFLATVRSRL